MLSIILSSSVVLFSYIYLRQFAPKWWITVFFISFNWLILEIAVYVYLLFIVHSGNFLFLIGNQGFLDMLIKNDMTKCIITHQDTHNSFYQIDPDLGYTVGKNKEFWVYHSSDQGLRANKDYSLTPSPTAMRLAVFGDSFVFCDGEPLEASWPYMLEQNNDGLEVMNFGVSGYGLSSSYLRYLKEGQKFNPDLVFINYILLGDRDWIEGGLLGGTELRRSTLYRPLLTLNNDQIHVRHFTPLDLFDKNLREEYLDQPLHLTHSIWEFPLFSLTNTGLAIKNVFLLRKFNQTLAAQQGDPNFKKKRLLYNEHIIEDFLDQTLQQHTSVIFFYDRDFNDLPLSVQRILQQHSNHVVYVNGSKILHAYFDKLHLTPTNYLNSTNHYNPLGNQVYAEVMGQVLKHNHWGSGNRTFEFCAKTNSFQNISINQCQ